MQYNTHVYYFEAFNIFCCQHYNRPRLSLSHVSVLGFAVNGVVCITSEEIKAFTDEYFDFRLRERPSTASNIGIPKYQGQVEEWNYAAFDRRIVSSLLSIEEL